MAKFTREARLSMTDDQRHAAYALEQMFMGHWLEERMGAEDQEFARADDIGISQAQANAQAALQAANDAAAALLSELESKDPEPRPKSAPKTMPSPYAPGEGPRNPVDSVARPSAQSAWQDVIDSSFKPVDLDALRKPTNTSSHTVDFAQKIRDAQKQRGTG